VPRREKVMKEFKEIPKKAIKVTEVEAIEVETGVTIAVAEAAIKMNALEAMPFSGTGKK